MEEGDGMRCTRHPPRGRRNPVGSICAECLQEKLGRLVAGGGAARPYVSQSLASPPCCSSIRPTVVEAASLPASAEQISAGRGKAAAIPFFFVSRLRQSVKSRKEGAETAVKSKKRRSFWSLLQFQSSAISDEKGRTPETSPGSESQSSVSSFGRRVARSRSVGCGSRSFSGDVLGRISSGFGDCTLRRAESQRDNGRKLTIRTREEIGDGDEGLTPRLRRNWAVRALTSPIRAFRASSRLAVIAVASESSNAAPAEDKPT